MSHALLGGHSLALLSNEGLVDVGDDAATGDGRLDQGVELLVSPDRQLEMPGSDPLHLQVLGRIAGQLKHLRMVVFCKRGSQIQKSEVESTNVKLPQQ